MKTNYPTEKEWYEYEQILKDNSKLKRWNYYDDIQNDIMDLIWEYEVDGIVKSDDIKTDIRNYFDNLKINRLSKQINN